VLKCTSEDVIRAELIWAIKVATKNMSYRSCDGINETFNAMFPCSIPESFSLSRTKVSYLLTDALELYLKKQLIYDINSSKNSFSLHFDETTNVNID